MASPVLEKFTAWLSGSWDNQQQVQEETQAAITEFDRHLH
jgi:hypothetical protein